MLQRRKIIVQRQPLLDINRALYCFLPLNDSLCSWNHLSDPFCQRSEPVVRDPPVMGTVYQMQSCIKQPRQIYQPLSGILATCVPTARRHLDQQMYISVHEGFHPDKSPVLHPLQISPFPVSLHQTLISDPLWTQNQHTSLRADAVTSPPVSEACAYICRSSTPAASATVHAPNLASSCRDTVSQDDRKSFWM